MSELLNEGGRLVLGDVIIFFDTTQKQADEVLDVIEGYLGKKRAKAIKELRQVFKEKHPIKYALLEKYLAESGLKIEKVDKIFSIIGVVRAVKA